MRFSNLFVVPPKKSLSLRMPEVRMGDVTDTAADVPPKKLLRAGSGQPAGGTGAFITTQSIMSFPVASGLAAGIWQLLAKVFPPYGGTNPTLFAVSMVLAALIWAISITDPSVTMTMREKAIAGGIAVINGMCLAMSALGVKTIAG